LLYYTFVSSPFSPTDRPAHTVEPSPDTLGAFPGNNNDRAAEGSAQTGGLGKKLTLANVPHESNIYMSFLC